MNVIFIGQKNCGKTSVGRALTAKLGKKFIDTDDLIIERHNELTGHHQSVREIWQDHGEIYFRNLENKAIASLASFYEAVIATGGGALMEKENVGLLKKIGKLIYLDLSFSIWRARIEQQPLPTFLQNKNLADHYDMRKFLYQKMADVTISLGQQSIEEIVEMLCIKMSGFDL